MSTYPPPFLSLPSYLPHPSSTTPYWRSQVHPLDKHHSTPSLPSACDTLIIGTGLTGVSTAYHILTHPNGPESATPDVPSVLLIDARGACSGATARNGGHLKPAFISLASNRKTLGKDAAEEIKRFAEAQISALDEVVRKENIDCEFRRGKSWDVFLGDEAASQKSRDWKDWEAEGWGGIEGMDGFVEKEHGGKLSGEQLEEATHVRGAKMAVRASAAMLWAYKLTMGLLEWCVERGAQVQTETIALELVKLGGEGDGKQMWLVRTDRGEIRCNKVVVATNAYTAGLLEEYEGVIRPVKGVNSLVQKPEGDQRTPMVLNDSCNLHYGPGLASYIVPQPSGSTIVGGAFTAFKENAHERYDIVDDSTLVPGAEGGKEIGWGLKDVLPKWMKGCDDMSKGQVWSGIMGYTPDDMPHIGRVPGRDGVYIAAGFNGRGMLIIFLAAKSLARMMLEGSTLAQAGVPTCFETSEDRLRKWD
ncbi:MAG: hypothetical protein MMC23_007125 [Stictis urceolatum]|nr:hypothetical protein [Stictis urceolata]